MIELTGKQKRFLRAEAHHLDPLVMVGHQGVTDAVIRETREALDAHELIKVKFAENSEVRAKDGGPLLGDKVGAAFVQQVGRIAVLYAPRKKDPRIVLPKG